MGLLANRNSPDIEIMQIELLPDNMIKATRQEKAGRNGLVRISRVYDWPEPESKNMHLFLDIDENHTEVEQEFNVVSREIKKEGDVIDKYDKATLLHYWDLIETIEQGHDMAARTLKRYEAKTLPQMENFNGCKFFFFNYPNERDDELLSELGKTYYVKKKRFSHAKPEQRLLIVAWQIRDAIYHAVKFLNDKKFEKIQSKLIPLVDFEAHLLIQNNIRETRPGIMNIGGRSFNDIFGSERLLISMARLTHEEAELWYSLTMIMHSAKANGTLASAISEYVKMKPNAIPRTIKMMYDRAVTKFQKPLLKILGNDDPALSIWICQLVIEELLDREFLWIKPYRRKIEIMPPGNGTTQSLKSF